jgi:hypothetical protein
MLSVIILSAIMLSVMAPLYQFLVAMVEAGEVRHGQDAAETLEPEVFRKLVLVKQIILVADSWGKISSQSPSFNQTTWSLTPTNPSIFGISSVLIMFVNSCKVCVFSKIIFSSKFV